VTNFPGWYPDPTGRHPERYFDGRGLPTQHVRNDGVEFLDEGPSVSPAGSTRVTAQPVPLASYRAPAGNEYLWSPTAHVKPSLPATPDTRAPAPRRSLWLIGLACLLASLLVVTAGAAFLQHRDAARWKDRYQSEVSSYQHELHKNVALYASLVTTLQQLSQRSEQSNAR
jgi:Protein of unknown function (DUF2510)